MTVDTQTLTAYADGELGPEEAARVEAALAADPALRARLERQIALRARLSGAYDPVFDEPVPDALADALKTPAAEPAPIVRLRPGLRGRFGAAIAGFGLPQGAALAASLAVGLMLGLLAPDALRGAPDGYYAPSPDGLHARGVLAASLETRPAGGEARDGVAIALTFRDDGARWCRAFALETGESGLACREDDVWRVRTLTASPAEAGGEFRTASSAFPPALIAAIDAAITGDPLEPEAEAAAIAGGWGD